MVQYTVNLSDAENKALGHVCYSQQEWIDNFVKERCRNAIEQIVNEEIQRKLAAGEPITGTKEEIVLAADIKSGKQIADEDLAELQSRLNS